MATPNHTRSNSLPTSSTPLVSQFDEQFSRLKSSESASSSTSSTIISKLARLSDLYDCMDELLQLPSSQRTVYNQGLAEDVLEGSVKLLDICSTINDVLVQIKERAQQLQSILRRRCSKDEIAREVAQYLRSRKNAMKVITKALKDLKKIENNNALESNEITEAVSRLRKCQMVTLSVLESILITIAGPKGNLQRSNWESVVSKLVKSKGIASQQENELFLVGIEASDAALHPEKVRSGLENMEISIKNVEEGVEILFRHLIKTRTTILNILNC